MSSKRKDEIPAGQAVASTDEVAPLPNLVQLQVLQQLLWGTLWEGLVAVVVSATVGRGCKPEPEKSAVA